MGKVRTPPRTASFWVDPATDIDTQAKLAVAEKNVEYLLEEMNAVLTRGHEANRARGVGRTEKARLRLEGMQSQFDFIMTAATFLLGEVPKQIPSVVGSLWFAGAPPGAKNRTMLRKKHSEFDLADKQREALEALRVSSAFDSAADLRDRAPVLRRKLAAIYVIAVKKPRR
jgi:hypothetical protein